MSADIQQAAISYFGLPDGTQMVEGGPVGHFAFTVPLTEEHLRGIADRMKALSEVVDEPAVFTPAPKKDDMRDAYNALSPSEQGKYGSFGRYVQAQYAAPIEGHVKHIDAPVDNATCIWIPLGECSHKQQRADPPAKKEQGEYFLLIDSNMLTEEQRIKYGKGVA